MTQPYDIITIPDPVLKQHAHAIENITSDIKKQLDRMMVTLDEAGGIGLAANQVSILNRAMIVDVPDGMWQFGPEKNVENSYPDYKVKHRCATGITVVFF